MKKLLVANRGEIAVRVIRAADELGIPTVAVYSDVDHDAQHVARATESFHVGASPAAQSYLNPDAVIAAAHATGADAIHPGYGFLSENADFARRCEAEGITFVGPAASAIDLMGNKAAARLTAIDAGVPVVPGSTGGVDSVADALEAAGDIGLPLLIKAAAGGGGRGIRVVNSIEELEGQVSAAQTEARATFGDGTVYLERFVTGARHVEVQVFGDGQSTVHLYERECSLQRRRQKLIEEALAPNLAGELRANLAASAVALADAVGYQGAGTVEFLVDPVSEEYYFIEMNTRIQVEHPVTELVCGLDLVREQLRLASGDAMTFSQKDVSPRGASIELRINAEDPDNNFMPSPGTISELVLPAGPGIRVSSAVQSGATISPYYDSLIAKVIVWDVDRPAALCRARRALREFHIEGVKTTAPFLLRLLSTEAVIDGRYDTQFVERWLVDAEKVSSK